MAFQQIRARKHGGSQKAINRIVVHCTVSPCAPGWAIKIANYFQSSSAGGSAHYVVDPTRIVQCVPENVVAYHAPPNTGSIGIELCDWQKGAASRWNDDDHDKMLKLAAGLVRDIAKRHNIPIVKLSVADLKAGRKGICGHVDISHAFGLTDHGDPMMAGPFPWARFMDYIKKGTGSTVSSAPVAKNWTEDLVKELPTLKEGDEGYDIKTARALAFSRGGVKPEEYAKMGLESWLNNIKFDSGFKKVVIRIQKIAFKDAKEHDGVIGKNTWAVMFRVG